MTLLHQVPIRIREIRPEEDEIDYVLKSWMRSHRRGLPDHIPDRLYYAQQQALIGRLAARSSMVLAVDPNDTNVIYGFAAGKLGPKETRTLYLHFTYVRKEWRRFGIATALAGALGYQEGMEIVATHWSKELTYWWEPIITGPGAGVTAKSKAPRRELRNPFIVYNPFLLMDLGNPKSEI